jgi:hypothetical protein
MLIGFNPEKNDARPDIPVYVVKLDSLKSSAKLLDIILQIQRKRRWSEGGKEAENNYGQWLCDDYQVWDFILVLDMICKHYMQKSIQGVYSAWGNNHEIDWDKLASKQL